MRIKIVSFLLLATALSLSGCQQAVPTGTPTVAPTNTPIVIPPTPTPAPTATITPTPVPDFGQIGLPTDTSGANVFDFVDQLCNAQWFTEAGDLPCPGAETQADAGYVLQLDGSVQDLPSNIGLMLTFPPRTRIETVSSKYPEFEVKEGDRFQSVLSCRTHTFCDVVFMLGYFDSHGQTGLKYWHHIFTDSPVIVDYPLDGIAGKTVQFDLAVRAGGNRLDAYAVWIAPHVFRPAH